MIFIRLLLASIWCGRYFGTDLLIHWTLPLFLVFVFTADWIFGVVLMAIYVSVLLHEFGHAFAAKFLGIEVANITMLPIGGMARIALPINNPKKELLITIAGPAVNILLAPILVGIAMCLHQTGFDFLLADDGITLAVIFVWVAYLNIILFLFNLLPIFPMDGGRILRAYCSMIWGHEKATVAAGRTGQILAMMFGIVGFLIGAFLWPVIAVMLIVFAQAEIAHAKRRCEYERLD